MAGEPSAQPRFTTVDDLVVEMTHMWEEEFAHRTYAFIKDTKKHNTLWKQFIRWIGSIKRLHCLCTVEGSACECERPPPVLQPRTSQSELPVRKRTTPPSSPEVTWV